jgi:hypothetical protein
MLALNALSKRNPLAMSVVTAFGVVSVGDAGVQLMNDGAVDLRRNATPAVYSGLIAPAYVAWWRWLDVRFPGTGLGAVLRKAMANQVVTSVPNSVGYMAWCTYWLDSEASLSGRLRNELPSIIVAAFSFWLPVNAGSFMFVPLHQRVLFMSVVNCVWSGWLSQAVNGSKATRPGSALDSAAAATCTSATDAVSRAAADVTDTLPVIVSRAGAAQPLGIAR